MVQAIDSAGEAATLDFQYELLKYLCEYGVRQLIIPPDGAKLDFEGNPAVV